MSYNNFDLAAAAREEMIEHGFDPEQVKKIFGISDRYVPVMLITLGYPAPGNAPRKPRLSVDEVLAFNQGREF